MHSGWTKLLGCTVALTGCQWFGERKGCEEGAERCDGRKILTCVSAVPTGSSEAIGEWKKTGSCALLGEGLTCREIDDLATCVKDTADASVAATGSSMPRAGLVDPPAGPPVKWTRFDFRRRADEGYELEGTKEATIDFAPATAPSGDVAVVAYKADGRPQAAALVAFADDRGSAWLQVEGAAQLKILQPGGATAGEFSLGALSKTAALAVSGVEPEAELSPTLSVVSGDRTLETRDGLAVQTVHTIYPSTEALSVVRAGLQRMSPFAVSILSGIAFTGGTDRVRVLGSTLIIPAGDGAMASYRADPGALHLEMARQVALFLGGVSSGDVGFLGMEAEKKFAFPEDFSPEVAALIKERITPLLAKTENFKSAWSALHSVAVEGGLASSYDPRGQSVHTDGEAIAGGFSSQIGSAGPLQDFADYVAYATVPEKWIFGPCATIRSAPLDRLPPRALVHVAKLEATWGLGMIKAPQLEACTGKLSLEPASAGIVIHKATGERVEFREAIHGGQEDYSHGTKQVALTADRPSEHGVMSSCPASPLGGGLLPGQCLSMDAGTMFTVTAALTVSMRGPIALFRITSVGKRPDPEVGAGFYISDPAVYERSEAGGGLLLVTRLDEQRVEAHALLVRQGAKKPFFDAPVFPLVTGRYDVPLDEDGN